MKTPLAETRQYCSFYPGCKMPHSYEGIFYKGVKTNFYMPLDAPRTPFIKYTTPQELDALVDMIDRKLIKPPSDHNLEHFDLCTHVTWKPKQIVFAEPGEEEPRMIERMRIFGSSWHSRQEDEDIIKRVDIFHLTQYTKIVDLENRVILPNAKVFNYDYGFNVFASL